MNIGRYLLPYILLFLLILGGWFFIFLIERTRWTMDESPAVSSQSLNIKAGESLYHHDGSLSYSLSYGSAVFHSNGRWSATMPHLVAYDGNRSSFLLTAPLLNSSSDYEWFFSQGAVMKDERNTQQLQAASIGINVKEGVINMNIDARLRQENFNLAADKIQLESLDTKKQLVHAYGTPLIFQRQALSGAAQEFHFVTATEELSLSGNAKLEDATRNQELKANEIFIEDAGDTINLHSDVNLRQADIQLRAELAQLTRDEEAWTIQASGSPLVFQQQELRGEAKELYYISKTGNLSLQYNVILRDKTRQVKADRIISTKAGQDMAMHGNAELRQADLYLSGDRIRSMNAAPHGGAEQWRLQASGEPLHLHQAGLSVNASVLNYEENLAVITGNPLHFSYQEESLQLHGTGTSLTRNLANDTILLKGTPAYFFYEDEEMRLRGTGTSLTRNSANDTILLKGTPAQLQKTTEEPFNLHAQRMHIRSKEITLNGDIRIQDRERNITADYAVYDIATRNWQLTGKTAANKTDENYIEIIVPAK